jgi:IS5 family transposase
MKQISLFDEMKALERLSQLGDKLEWLDKVMDWKIFRGLLDGAKPDKSKSTKGGRPPYPNILMFKIMILQSLFNVSDEQAEYQINDRLSWKRFLGLTLSEKAPDRTTIWEFREMLVISGLYDKLFTLFTLKMTEIGVITRKGSIVDASFEEAPRQRNTREENRIIKEENDIPEEWLKEENANKLAQKDVDARWTKKNDEKYFGYKNHIKCDADSKMIVEWRVTDASVHDSQMIMALIDSFDLKLWADSAYVGEEIRNRILGIYPEIKLYINEKGYKNKPLTDEQKASNREKSRVRSRVEHIFGHMASTASGFTVRTIGIMRAECVIVMKNLAYNISRYATMRKMKNTPKMA